MIIRNLIGQLIKINLRKKLKNTMEKNSKYLHNNFMTEKEKNYVEQINKKLIFKAPNYSIMSLCFTKSELEPFIISKREKTFSFSEVEKTINSLNLAKSRKIPRDVNLNSKQFCSDKIVLALEIDEVLDLILKLKYNYIQLLPNEEEYSPINSISNQNEENFKILLEKVRNNCNKFFNSQKFINHFSILILKLTLKSKKDLFALFLQAEYFESELFIDFLRKNFKEIPSFDELELQNFKFIFYKTNVTFVLLTILILKNKCLANVFIEEIKNKSLDVLFESKETKYVWQCFAIISSYSSKFLKKGFYEFLNDKVKKSINENDEFVEIYLKSIGKEVKDYK